MPWTCGRRRKRRRRPPRARATAGASNGAGSSARRRVALDARRVDDVLRLLAQHAAHGVDERGRRRARASAARARDRDLERGEPRDVVGAAASRDLGPAAQRARRRSRARRRARDRSRRGTSPAPTRPVDGVRRAHASAERAARASSLELGRVESRPRRRAPAGADLAREEPRLVAAARARVEHALAGARADGERDDLRALFLDDRRLADAGQARGRRPRRAPGSRAARPAPASMLARRARPRARRSIHASRSRRIARQRPIGGGTGARREVRAPRPARPSDAPERAAQPPRRRRDDRVVERGPPSRLDVAASLRSTAFAKPPTARRPRAARAASTASDTAANAGTRSRKQIAYAPMRRCARAARLACAQPLRDASAAMRSSSAALGAQHAVDELGRERRVARIELRRALELGVERGGGEGVVASQTRTSTSRRDASRAGGRRRRSVDELLDLALDDVPAPLDVVLEGDAHQRDEQHAARRGSRSRARAAAAGGAARPRSSEEERGARRRAPGSAGG